MAGKSSSEDMKKVKAAAAGRSKKGRNWKLQYMIWIGGSMGVIVLAMVMLIVNPDRGPFQRQVNDQNHIKHLNRNMKTWKASASSFFEGWTLGDVRQLEGISVSQMGGAMATCQIPEIPLPESFDSREKWPQCFNSPIYTMGNCTASWAIATASALSNRYCISDPVEHAETMLSPQQLLSCDTRNRGCNGGDIDSAWNYIEQEGLVSEMCFPYQADSSVSCQSTCTTEVPLKAASHCVLNSDVAIRREVFSNGPVVAPIFLVDDFLVYRAGIYQESPTAMQISDARRQRIIHAAKIVGWGNMDGKPYWLIENSWGEDWGENGYARVVRGTSADKKEGIVVESFVLAGTPSSKKVVDDMDDFEESDADLEDIEADLDDDADGEDV